MVPELLLVVPEWFLRVPKYFFDASDTVFWLCQISSWYLRTKFFLVAQWYRWELVLVIPRWTLWFWSGSWWSRNCFWYCRNGLHWYRIVYWWFRNGLWRFRNDPWWCQNHYLKDAKWLLMVPKLIFVVPKWSAVWLRNFGDSEPTWVDPDLILLVLTIFWWFRSCWVVLKRVLIIFWWSKTRHTNTRL